MRKQMAAVDSSISLVLHLTADKSQSGRKQFRNIITVCTGKQITLPRLVVIHLRGSISVVKICIDATQNAGLMENPEISWHMYHVPKGNMVPTKQSRVTQRGICRKLGKLLMVRKRDRKGGCLKRSLPLQIQFVHILRRNKQGTRKNLWNWLISEVFCVIPTL